jgi:hypothetical protein
MHAYWPGRGGGRVLAGPEGRPFARKLKGLKQVSLGRGGKWAVVVSALFRRLCVRPGMCMSAPRGKSRERQKTYEGAGGLEATVVVELRTGWVGSREDLGGEE